MTSEGWEARRITKVVSRPTVTSDWPNWGGGKEKEGEKKLFALPKIADCWKREKEGEGMVFEKDEKKEKPKRRVEEVPPRARKGREVASGCAPQEGCQRASVKQHGKWAVDPARRRWCAMVATQRRPSLEPA